MPQETVVADLPAGTRILAVHNHIPRGEEIWVKGKYDLHLEEHPTEHTGFMSVTVIKVLPTRKDTPL